MTFLQHRIQGLRNAFPAAMDRLRLRETLRAERQYNAADQVRQTIEAEGYFFVLDGKEGTALAPRFADWQAPMAYELAHGITKWWREKIPR